MIQTAYLMEIRTAHVRCNADYQPGDRLDQPQVAARFIEAWNEATDNPPDVESFSVLGLDERHRLVYAETLTRGTRNQAPVDVGRMYRGLLTAGCSGFIVTHNHPSGNLEPSRDDILLTERIVKGAPLIGLSCLDHIITAGPGRHLSLRSVRPGSFTV